MTITGASEYSWGIFLNSADNCSIISNNLIYNYDGIAISSNSDNNIIYGNYVANSDLKGISVGGTNNTMMVNTIKNNWGGISVDGPYNTISKNIINGNLHYGIGLFDLNNSSISENTITNNIMNGIYVKNSNNVKISENIIKNNGITGYTGDEKYNGISLSNSSANINFNVITGNAQYGLYNTANGTVNAKNNWWGSNSQPVVSSTSQSDICNASGTVTYNPWIVLSVNVSSTNSGGNTSVTADLTHNNQGGDTSSQGHIPNGVPVNFATNLGTIVTSAYTVKGKATTILDLGSTQSKTVTVSASLDKQSVSKQKNVATGSAVLKITSTAINNSTGQPLNKSYTIPLNSSVTWVSVLWINTGTLQEELQIRINDVNGAAVNNVQIHGIHSTDNLTIDLTYPGVAGQNVTVIDPDNSSNVMNLSFPGNSIHRVSQIIYANGTYNGSEAGYEGVRSFAIATTKVTPDILNYWLNYMYVLPSGGISASYGTFLTALMVEYCHDQVADNVKSEYNTTWNRTSPIIVSAGDEAYNTYLTLECDHGMGMTVVGLPEDMAAFRFACSSTISPIEYNIMKKVGFNFQSNITGYGPVGSVITDLSNAFMNGTSLEAFESNNFVILKATGRDDLIFVIDPETGIVRDMNTFNNFCGAYCYSLMQTALARNLGYALISSPPDWLQLIDNASIKGGNIIDPKTPEDKLFEKKFDLPTSLGSGDIGKPLKIAVAIIAVAAGAGCLAENYYNLQDEINKLNLSTTNNNNTTVIIIKRVN